MFFDLKFDVLCTLHTQSKVIRTVFIVGNTDIDKEFKAIGML